MANNLLAECSPFMIKASFVDFEIKEMYCSVSTKCYFSNPCPTLHSLWEQCKLFIFAHLSLISMQVFFIIAKLVLLLIMHNAFAPGREAANKQSIENLTTPLNHYKKHDYNLFVVL
jgi:hypothetical protein